MAEGSLVGQAQYAGRNAALLVKHESCRHSLRRDVAGHRQEDPAVGIVEAGVGNAEVALEGLGVLLAVPDVDAVELHILRLVLLMQRNEVRSLFPAGCARCVPEVQYRHLSWPRG